MSDPAPYLGTRWYDSDASDFNALHFVIRQFLATIANSAIVQVVAVYGTGLNPTGTVDVLPLVNQVDGRGNPTPHGIVPGLPFFRVQGGANAVVIDPVVGDIGLAVFADRDVSTVKTTRAQANPGSFRQHDMADGFYLGGFLNGVPTQYVQFTSGGIDIVSSGTVAITSAGLTHNGVNIGSTHEHGGVQTGTGNTGVPH